MDTSTAFFVDPKSDTVSNKELQDMYTYCETNWGGYMTEASRDVESYLGAQFTAAEQQSAELLDRNLLVFNKIKRQVKLLSGYEIRNRHMLKISPIGQEDDEVSRQHSAVIAQQLALFGGYDQLSMCFKMGQHISGSNLLEFYKDRNWYMQISRIGYNQHFLDPAITKQDMSDCSFYLTGRYINEETARKLVPLRSRSLPDVTSSSGSSRWSSLQDINYRHGKRKRLYEELWENKPIFKKTVISRVSGQDIKYDDLVNNIYQGDKNRADRVIAEAKLPDGTPSLVVVDKPENKVTVKIFVDGTQVFSGPNPLGIDEYNVVWFPGEYFHEVGRSDLKLQPFVRALRDPQKAKNRRINQTIDIIESQLTAYKVVRENSVKNFEVAFESGQGRTVVVKGDADEHPLSEAFDLKMAPDIPAGHFNLLTALDKEETEIGGMNEEIFGSDNAKIPGILARHRTGQALTGHQDIFETFRVAKKLLGRKLLKANQINQDPVRVYRMINEMPVDEFYEIDLCYYDCQSTEGVMTENQQQQLYGEIKDLLSTWPQFAEMLTAEDIFEFLPLQAKKQIREVIGRRQQAREQQQAKMQEDQDRMNRLVEAETQAKIARAQEDTSDVIVNRASTMLKNAQAAGEIANLKNEQITDLAERLARIELMVAQSEAARAQARATGKENNPTTKKNSPAKQRPKRRR